MPPTGRQVPTPATPGGSPPALDTLLTELRVLETGDRLLALYDLGLDACARASGERLTAVLQELISTLDFQRYPEVAEGFHRIYTFCLEQAVAGGFDRAAFVLQDLRGTLLQASPGRSEDAAASA